LDTAKGLFVEKGYGQTTIEDIARAMSVAKGMVYHYFRSKDENL
jgi:AcrR family transcriptional regulator